MTRCPHCQHQFRRMMFRNWTKCPRCQRLLAEASVATNKRDDDTPDIAGLAVGYATGIPISPTHGISGAALVGAALHSSTEAKAETAHSVHESPPSGGGDFGGGGASASASDSSSSSSGGGGDSGGGGSGGGSD